jgi:hypothetical protein
MANDMCVCRADEDNSLEASDYIGADVADEVLFYHSWADDPRYATPNILRAAVWPFNRKTEHISEPAKDIVQDLLRSSAARRLGIAPPPPSNPPPCRDAARLMLPRCCSHTPPPPPPPPPGMEQRGGYAALRRHPFFRSFDWQALRDQRLPAPHWRAPPSPLPQQTKPQRQHPAPVIEE